MVESIKKSPTKTNTRLVELLKFKEEFKEFNSVDASQTWFKGKLDRGRGIKPVNICFF